MYCAEAGIEGPEGAGYKADGETSNGVGDDDGGRKCWGMVVFNDGNNECRAVRSRVVEYL